MNNNKKIFLVIFCIFIHSTIVVMDPPKKNEKKKTNKKNMYIPKWVRNTGDALLGRAPLQPIIAQISQEMVFKNFQTDIQQAILDLLTKGRLAQSLPETAQSINQLALINKDLNQLINDPVYCLQTIKDLSARFNCSNYQACTVLQTAQAKEQLKLQKDLLLLCGRQNADEWSFALLCNQGADLYFTYPYEGGRTVMPFMVALINNSKVAAYLIKAGIDINYPNKKGITPLMMVAEYNNIMSTELLVKNPDLLINQQDNQGNTALHYLLNTKMPHMQILQLLLKHGANPHIANKDGITPLDLAKKINNIHLLNIIQNTTSKKK